MKAVSGCGIESVFVGVFVVCCSQCYDISILLGIVEYCVFNIVIVACIVNCQVIDSCG